MEMDNKKKITMREYVKTTKASRSKSNQSKEVPPEKSQSSSSLRSNGELLMEKLVKKTYPVRVKVKVEADEGQGQMLVPVPSTRNQIPRTITSLAPIMLPQPPSFLIPALLPNPMDLKHQLIIKIPKQPESKRRKPLKGHYKYTAPNLYALLKEAEELEKQKEKERSKSKVKQKPPASTSTSTKPTPAKVPVPWKAISRTYETKPYSRPKSPPPPPPPPIRSLFGPDAPPHAFPDWVPWGDVDLSPESILGPITPMFDFGYN